MTEAATKPLTKAKGAACSWSQRESELWGSNFHTLKGFGSVIPRVGGAGHLRLMLPDRGSFLPLTHKGGGGGGTQKAWRLLTRAANTARAA